MTDPEVQALLTRFVAAYGPKFGHTAALGREIVNEWAMALQHNAAIDANAAAGDWIAKEARWPTPAQICDTANAYARGRAKAKLDQDAPVPFCPMCRSFDLYEQDCTRPDGTVVQRFRVMHAESCAAYQPNARYEYRIAEDTGRVWYGGRAPATMTTQEAA